MNVDNGRMFLADNETIQELMKEHNNIFPVPDELEPDAMPDELEPDAMAEIKRQMIDGTPLDLSGGSALASWAAEKRQEITKKPNKKKRKNKIAKMSRARNR